MFQVPSAEGHGSNYAVSNRYQISVMVVSLSEDSIYVQCVAFMPI
jgi:hypothetical protein